MRDFLSQLLPYALTGGIAAILDAGGFALLVDAGLGIALAGVLSFCTAAVVNYLLTSRFVFRRARSVRGFVLFLCGALIGLSINVGLTMFGFYVLGLPPVVAKLIGIGTAFFANFVINLCVVFRPAR
jgi:putative flippase GtrA